MFLTLYIPSNVHGQIKDTISGAWYSWEPYQYLNTQGKITGLDYALVSHISKEAGIKIQFNPKEQKSWIQNQQEVEQGIKQVTAGAFWTEERNKRYFISDAYRYEWNTLYILKGEKELSKILDINHLLSYLIKHKLKLGVVAGYRYTSTAINKFVDKNGLNTDIIRKSNDEAQNFDNLVNKKVDIIISDRITGAQIIWKNKNLWPLDVNEHLIQLPEKPIHLLMHRGSDSLTIKKNKALMVKLNNSIKKNRINGGLKHFIGNYLFPVLMNITVHTDWFLLIDYIGAVFFAIAGFLLARECKFDIFGIIVMVTLLTSGGGIIRDLIVGRPLAFLNDINYVFIILSVASIGFILVSLHTFLISRYPRYYSFMQSSSKHFTILRILIESIALGAYTIIGVGVAIEMNLKPLWIWGPLLGVVTSCGGGILASCLKKDTTLQSLKGGADPEISICGGLIFSIFLLWQIDRLNPQEVFLGVLITIILMALTSYLFYFLKWRSPILKLDHEIVPSKYSIQNDNTVALSTPQYYKIKQDVNTLLKNYKKRSKILENYTEEDLPKIFPFSPIPEHAISNEKYIATLREHIMPFSQKVSSPKFIGHMTSALPDFTEEIAVIIATLNQNVVKTETSLATTYIERQTLAMMHQLFYTKSSSFYETHTHDKESTLGIVTSGGTLANLTALQCARNLSFKTIESSGVTKNNSVVICSQLGHYSIKKAMGILGLGSDNLIQIPVDENHKIDLKILEDTIDNCKKNNTTIIAIIGIVGSTESGSIDPLKEMGHIAKQHNIYFHVDAAWGGSTKFSDQYSYLLDGIELTDSITVDGHKQLYLPMGIGLVLFKDPKTAAVIEKGSNYIIRKSSIDLGKRSIEGSRPANSLYLYSSLQLLGKKKYASLIDLSFKNAREMANFINNSNYFELLTYPETNILLYRYIPSAYQNIEKTKLLNEELNKLNIALQQKQKLEGNSFVSYTTISIRTYNNQNIIGLRIVMANPLVKSEHLRSILEEQIRIGEQINNQVLEEENI